MLQKLIREIQKSGNTISLRELSRKLDIEPSALEGLLEYCVSKGILGGDEKLSVDQDCSQPSCECGSSCEGYDGCPFVARMPKTYSLDSRNQS